MIETNIEESIEETILELVDYGIEKGLIEKRDSIYVINRLLDLLNLVEFRDLDQKIGQSLGDGRKIGDILDSFRDYAVKSKLAEDDSVEILDLFDTKIMDTLAKRPSEIEKDFWSLYEKSPQAATEYYYDFAKNINYIREDRIKKDIKWIQKTEYGDLDITINMSKPEKDSRSIAKEKLIKTSSYPKCLLCRENEGYAGRIGYPARDNHRIIQLDLNHENWFMQYSPYVYYNEHCIVLKESHDPMRITRETFKRLLDFVEVFPHYILGSNADLPIVGGSILSHDHFQGGGYEFSMERAQERNHQREENGIEVSTLRWPMSVIRLKGDKIDDLVNLGDTILSNWINYTDKSVNIVSHTGDTRHNTITPVARFKDGKFQLDLVLRNNRCDELSPEGIFHPRQEYHNIKKENIGVIEVMGLAVLPSRLKKEMEEIKRFLLEGKLEAIRLDEDLNKHYDFAKTIKEKYKIDKIDLQEVIENEIGEIFSKVLKDAGVFKDTEKGQEAFRTCLEILLGQ
nr:UDP-glucose--hexose-1-phosphate uridylyltransferase [Tissierella sp.]